MSDTIFALSTSPGKAGVAVFRISGPSAFDAVERLAGDVPPMRNASLRSLRDGGELIDEALVIGFAENHSFTGERVAELHTHGSPAVIARLQRLLGEMPGLRAADHGEFTRRAMTNGRMDLSQVEGLSDLLAAETELQRQQAIRVMRGGLSEKAEHWRQRLLRALMLLEVTIDFVDEEAPFDVLPEVAQLIRTVSDELGNEIAGYATAERIREGFEIAIVGPPNVGKSTLMNAIAGREAAIVSQYAGTTRDVIEVRLDLQGLPVTLLDTAGIRETGEEVERIGIERALARADQADIRVILAEVGCAPAIEPRDDDIVVTAKGDLADGPFAVSGKTGGGISELLSQVSHRLSDRIRPDGIAIRERHKAGMDRARTALHEAEALLQHGEIHTELAAESLRSAQRALDFLVGRIDVEEVLGEIFAGFCIGK